MPHTTALAGGSVMRRCDHFGLRLMALDGTVEDVPETPANARAFYVHMQHRYCCIMGLSRGGDDL